MIDRPEVSRGWNLMELFNDFIRDMALYDVPLQGCKYTWSNGHPQPTFSKIDRVFLTKEWTKLYTSISLSPAARTVSDHLPLILHCKQFSAFPRPPRIENFWMRYPEFTDISRHAWERSPTRDEEDSVTSFVRKLQGLQKELKDWSRSRFSKLEVQLEQCKRIIIFFDALEQIRYLSHLEGFIKIKTKERSYELANNVEMKWQQRARCRWLQHGDKNTHFFHTYASTRARRKRITSIHHEGRELSNKNDITAAVFDHFAKLLGTSPDTIGVNLISLYSPKLDLHQLEAPFTIQEVENALMALANNKAIGPDGLPNEFSKQQWPLIKQAVLRIFDDLYNEQVDLTSLNVANVILLPKIDMPSTISDYRPISIINFIPKLIAKVLANRLQEHLPSLVSERQTAFIRSRFIAENFLASRELLHHVEQSKEPTLLLKLDFSKAFDTLSWDFLLNVLTARGFPHKYIAWVHHLLKTSSSRILLNDETTPTFTHKRGLRQGDPMSPLLFIIAVDVLQRMIHAANTMLPHTLTSKIQEPIVALQYADDTILVTTIKGQTVRYLMMVLHSFSQTSGLAINFHKSACIPFSVDQVALQSIKELVACPITELPITYLGLPLTTKRLDKSLLMTLVEKIERRLAAWKGKVLSRGGRMQLIQAVISAIPIYYMACFRLPTWVINRIDRIRRSFLWAGANHSAGGISLTNWDTVCLPKKNGGLGLINLKLQNMAMLLRWWWKIYEPQGSV
jgi:Reverse transcriptase (RNA-dependent DNA polymerase)